MYIEQFNVNFIVHIRKKSQQVHGKNILKSSFGDKDLSSMNKFLIMEMSGPIIIAIRFAA